MKLIFSLLILSLPIFAFGQNKEDLQYEAAVYQINLGQSASTSDIDIIDNQLDKSTFMQMKQNLLKKEGIFKVELVNDEKTIRVYHFDYIDLEGIKELVLPTSYQLNFIEAKAFHVR